MSSNRINEVFRSEEMQGGAGCYFAWSSNVQLLYHHGTTSRIVPP